MSDEVTIQVVPDDVAQQSTGQPGLEILQGDPLTEAVKYLQEQYNTAKSELETRNQKVAKWRRNVEAFASDAPKNSPFQGASNITVPLAQTIWQGVYGKIRGTFDARDPFVSVKPLRSDEPSLQMFKTAEKYLNILAESPSDLNWPKVKDDIIGDNVLCGGIFVKVPYTVAEWRVKDARGSDSAVVYHDGPEIVPIPLERAFLRRGIPDIARLPWIATDTPMTENELRAGAGKGEYSLEAVTTILKDKRTSATDNEAQQQEAEFFDSQETMGLYDITEVYFFWDVDGSGVFVDLLFLMHMPSGAVLQQQYNVLGKRFITSGKYVHRPFALSGRGTGQLTESGQTEVTAIHNMRNDNMKIANMRMVLTRRNSGLKANEKIWPGKIIEVDDPQKDVREFQLGEVYPSSLEAENTSWSIFQKASGISDTALGFADSTMGSRDSVRGSAMRLQQGDSILASAALGMKTMFSEIFQMVWLQLIANKDRVMARERLAKRLSDQELVDLEQALSMTVAEVPMRMAFVIKTAEADKTFEAKRQSMLSLTQIFAQFSQQTIPLAMQLFGPTGQQMKAQAPDMFNYMARILTGSCSMMEDVFKFFGQYNAMDYVPDLSMIDKFLDAQQQIGATLGGAGAAMGLPSGGVPGAPGAAPTGSAGAVAQPAGFGAGGFAQGGAPGAQPQ
jgi:hypothetical protein